MFNYILYQKKKLLLKQKNNKKIKKLKKKKKKIYLPELTKVFTKLAKKGAASSLLSLLLLLLLLLLSLSLLSLSLLLLSSLSSLSSIIITSGVEEGGPASFSILVHFRFPKKINKKFLSFFLLNKKVMNLNQTNFLPPRSSRCRTTFAFCSRSTS